ncbi:hypothetical protein TNCV_330361 [Trichonephila clavipes]|nr:hypothetical protein TNCV_330361 [Trichonephila clavipes]
MISFSALQTKQVPVATTTMCSNEDGNTERRSESRWSLITSSREDKNVMHMTLVDRATPSRALSQELESFARQQVSARMVRRRLLQHGL